MGNALWFIANSRVTSCHGGHGTVLLLQEHVPICSEIVKLLYHAGRPVHGQPFYHVSVGQTEMHLAGSLGHEGIGRVKFPGLATTASLGHQAGSDTGPVALRAAQRDVQIMLTWEAIFENQQAATTDLSDHEIQHAIAVQVGGHGAAAVAVTVSAGEVRDIEEAERAAIQE